MIGREGDMTHADEACIALEAEIERLRPALVALGEESPKGMEHDKDH